MWHVSTSNFYLKFIRTKAVQKCIENRNRNSAIANKPRYTFVQYAMAWLTPIKHAPPHMCYRAEFGRYGCKRK